MHKCTKEIHTVFHRKSFHREVITSLSKTSYNRFRLWEVLWPVSVACFKLKQMNVSKLQYAVMLNICTSRQRN